jgi:hypothetical protein
MPEPCRLRGVDPVLSGPRTLMSHHPCCKLLNPLVRGLLFPERIVASVKVNPSHCDECKCPIRVGIERQRRVSTELPRTELPNSHAQHAPIGR